MTKSSAALAPDRDWRPDAANSNAAAGDARTSWLEAELAAVEPLVGAAILVTTAFRMRDEAGLIETLRRLTAAVAELEARRG